MADRKDSVDSSKPAYTFEWMGEAAQVTGKLPQSAAAVLLQAGQSTPLTVGDDGSVAANVLSKTAATLRISLSGYYDMVLARPGDQMTGTWNIGEIKAEDLPRFRLRARLSSTWAILNRLWARIRPNALSSIVSITSI